MPPFMNTPPVDTTCVVCGGTFPAKRPAKYCSTKCRESRRPPRSPEQREKARAYRREYYQRVEVKDHTRVLARERNRAIKDWLNDFKVARGCVDCGYRASPYALDIDHMDGKTANVSNLKSITAILAEMDRHRCVVRCANCHRIKSWETQTWVRG